MMRQFALQRQAIQIVILQASHVHTQMPSATAGDAVQATTIVCYLASHCRDNGMKHQMEPQFGKEETK